MYIYQQSIYIFLPKGYDPVEVHVRGEACDLW